MSSFKQVHHFTFIQPYLLYMSYSSFKRTCKEKSVLLAHFKRKTVVSNVTNSTRYQAASKSYNNNSTLKARFVSHEVEAIQIVHPLHLQQINVDQPA